MKSLNGKFHFAEKFKMNAAKSIKCMENNVYNVIFNELNDKLITYSRMFFFVILLMTLAFIVHL